MTASSFPSIKPPSQSFHERKLDITNEISSLLDAVPDFIWDDAATSLLDKGVATVRLSVSLNRNQPQSRTKATTSFEEIHSRAFCSARRALDCTLHQKCTEFAEDNAHDGPTLLPMIAPDADSAHVTGFHHAGGLSRYNVQREGIVFSDDQCSNDHHRVCNNHNANDKIKKRDHSNDHDRNSILSDLSGMFWSLHGIADRVLLSIEKRLELSEEFLQTESKKNAVSKNTGYQMTTPPKGWFQQQLGPTQTSSQWHMKRFVIGDEEEDVTLTNDTLKVGESTTEKVPAMMRTELGERITLPMHTDPSLISVVIHDSDGENYGESIDGKKEAPGALGLQYFHPNEKRWEEPEAHGHSVATIFVGSVLAHLTCGTYPAAKHRVVETARHNDDTQRSMPKQRMAATLFVRPQPSSLLLVPLPSPWLLQRIEEEEEEAKKKNPASKKKSVAKPPITFDAWLQRVARNYEKQKKNQKNKSRKKA